jgi:hypothetical protein
MPSLRAVARIDCMGVDDPRCRPYLRFLPPIETLAPAAVYAVPTILDRDLMARSPILRVASISTVRSRS